MRRLLRPFTGSPPTSSRLFGGKHVPEASRRSPSPIPSRTQSARNRLRAASTRWLLAALAVLLASSAGAQTGARVIMTTDRANVNVGEALRLQVRAEVTGGEIERFDLPDLSAFEIRSQRVTRPFSMRFSFNGQQQIQQSSTVYDFVLVPLAPGRVELTPAQIMSGGQAHRSNPLTIVVGGSAAQSTPAPTESTAVDPSLVDPVAFIRTTVDNETPYVGEQVTVDILLYTRSPIRTAPQTTRNAEADGFWVHDLLPPQRTLEARPQVIGGVRYHEYLIKRFAAFPLQAGDLRIGAPTMSVATGSMFDLFQGPAELERTGQEVVVRARPLPEPVPPRVVVGRYAIEAQLDRQQARTGDAITLTAIVRGEGNLRDVQLVLPPVDGVRVLEPRVEDRIEQPNDRVGGERRFEWLLVPQRAGHFELPRLTIDAFDPRDERYSRVEGPVLAVVAAGSAVIDELPADEPTEAPETDAEAAPTFGPIRNRSALARTSEPVSSHGWYLAVLFAIPLVFLLALGIETLAVRRRAARSERARAAKQLLDNAEQLARRGDAKGFYAAISQSLSAVLEARLGEPVGGLTHDLLRRHLHDRGMDDDLVRRLIEELEGCDFARFSSVGGSGEEMGRCLDRSRALVTRLDRFAPVAADLRAEQAT